MRALVLREIQSFFSSLLGYTVVAVFLLFSSLFLWLFPGGWNILDSGMASLDPFFAVAPWVLMFLIPAVTMRSFAEEHRAGTLELLLTRPLTEGQVVLAKFLGAWAVSLAAPDSHLRLCVGGGHAGTTRLELGSWGGVGVVPRIGCVFRGVDRHWHCGVQLHGATVGGLSRAMLTSIVAYFGFGAIADFAWLGAWEHAFVQLGMESHFDAMSHGRLDSRDVLYFATWMALSVLVSRFVLALRRGRVVREGTSLLLSNGVVAVIVVLGQLVHGAVDLTAEKRHTLAPGTLELLDGLQDDVLVTCYLTGELPQEWKRLESEVESLLKRMAQASGREVDVPACGFVRHGRCPNRGAERAGVVRTRSQVYTNRLRGQWQAGLPNDLARCDDFVQGEEEPVQFFGSDLPQADQAMIQGSINTLEFNISSGIKRSTSFEPKSIAILEGHGELEDLAMADLVSTLEEDHLVARVKLDGRLNVLSEKLGRHALPVNRYDLLIVAKPDSAFSDKDKVIVDQFVMNGGRVLWMVDPVLTDLDSLRTQETFGSKNDLRLYDQLFDYGVRLNRN